MRHLGCAALKAKDHRNKCACWCMDGADSPCTAGNMRIIGTGHQRNLHVRFVCGWCGPALGGAQLLTVWGAGETVVARWQSEGCHTLADVAARSDLSAQQVHSWMETQALVVRLLLLLVCLGSM